MNDFDLKRPSRRSFLRQILSAAGSMSLAKFALSQASQAKRPAQPNILSPEDDAFLNDLEKTTFQFFWEQANPTTGLVKDRANARTETDNGYVGSIAATGFGLTALCIGERRGFIPRPAALERVLVTLRALWGKLPNHRGFFYHWANVNTGERVWDSEVSSVDTAILLCGVLTCREHFQVAEVQALADDIYGRVEWTW